MEKGITENNEEAMVAGIKVSTVVFIGKGIR